MAQRARDHRKDIPGYDETRPDRDARKREHRKVRHATNQMLGELVILNHILESPGVTRGTSPKSGRHAREPPSWWSRVPLPSPTSCAARSRARCRS